MRGICGGGMFVAESLAAGMTPYPDFTTQPSDFRYAMTLAAVLSEHGITSDRLFSLAHPLRVTWATHGDLDTHFVALHLPCSIGVARRPGATIGDRKLHARVDAPLDSGGDTGEPRLAPQSWSIAGFRHQLLRRDPQFAHKPLGLFRRRGTWAACHAVILEVKRIGGRQPLHDIRLCGFIAIDWAHIRRVGDTGHSVALIGGAGDFLYRANVVGSLWVRRPQLE